MSHRSAGFLQQNVKIHNNAFCFHREKGQRKRERENVSRQTTSFLGLPRGLRLNSSP